MKNLFKIMAAGALMLGASTMGAQAFPATAQTGETAGLAAGAPLPEGVYFVNTLDWGVRTVRGGPDVKLGVDIPVIAWSTPWKLFGGNIQIIGATPVAHIDVGARDNPYGFYNPFLAGRIAFDLGGGFGVSYLSGIYFNVGDSDVRVRATTWRQDFAVSYTDNGWNLTANLIWGITFDSDKCRLCVGSTANGFNLDLTATKTFGKWEVGAVAFGSTEYDTPFDRPKQKQFAVGPLIGYNFGPVILQTFLTRDVYTKNFAPARKDTRFWSRIIIPLWSPEAPIAPLVTKY